MRGEIVLLDEHGRVAYAQTKLSARLAHNIERVVRSLKARSTDGAHSDAMVAAGRLRYHVFFLNGPNEICTCVYIKRVIGTGFRRDTYVRRRR